MVADPHQNLRDRLKEADPARSPLEKARAQQIKAKLLSSLDDPGDRLGFRLPRFVWVTTLALVLAFAMVWRVSMEPKEMVDVIQTASQDKNAIENLRKTRVSELRFTTPGGTRIIWQFQNQRTLNNQ